MLDILLDEKVTKNYCIPFLAKDETQKILIFLTYVFDWLNFISTDESKLGLMIYKKSKFLKIYEPTAHSTGNFSFE